MRYSIMLSMVVGVFLNIAWTQESGNGIFLNNATVYPSNLSNTASRDVLEWPTNNCTDKGCYAIIQLQDIPDADQELILSNAGITLLAYIPNKAYLATYVLDGDIPFPDFVSAIIPLQGINKRPNIPFSLSNGSEEEATYDLVALAFPGIYPIELAAALIEIGAEITHLDQEQLQYRIAASLLPEILNCPLLLYTESLPSSPVSEGRIGRSNLRLKGVNQGPGMGYDGTGIAMAIGDDGSVLHLDFHGRIIDHTRLNTGNHGEMTVGMAAGGGNIDQAAEGAAPGADVHVFDIGNYEHITDAVNNFTQYGIVITSTSYGEGCGDSYNLGTQSIDQQVHDNPQLLHCFSAGNHATDPCSNPYSWLGPNSMGAYYATITGGRKAGKNVLAIGNNRWNDIILSSSSRGPTPDGRTKPDLCALGQSDYTTGEQNTYRQSSGTSAAAPNVAGALAGLYQYYKESHNNQYPSSALIKALALNTADDQGPAGPDFNYGWGRLNAGNALESLMQHQYFESQISHGQQHSFQFAVPSGTLRVKVMLYWHDAAGSVLSSRALVNDLDLSLRTPSSDIHLPWRPNPAFHLDSLALPAQPGRDRINNAEQVVIDAPTPGYYNVLVDGYQVPVGAQSYVIVYQLEMAPIEVISPRAGSCLVPQEMTLLSWDAVGNQGSFSIDYSLNNGQSWQSLATNIAGDQRNYLWTVPDLVNAEFKIKVKRANAEAVSEGMAVIASTPIFDVQYLNSTQAAISWGSIAGATGYKIYVLGEKQMEVVASTSDLSHLLPAIVGQEYWISVAPVFGDKIGRRANARIYQHYGCERYVTLDIQFDQYPNETSWYILNQNGTILEQGGPYTSQLAHSSISLNICLPPGCYTLVMADAYNDGLCCTNGNGYYRLTSINGNILAEGSQFESFDYKLFCPEEVTTSLLSIETEVIQHISCFGEQDGIARVVVSGGSGNYSYQWSNGSQSSTAQYLAAGFYQVTVSDGVTSQVQSIQINQPSALSIDYTTKDASCEDGQILLNTSGGTPPYTYDWLDGNNQESRQDLQAGNYFVIATDVNGCIQTANININQLEALEIQATISNPSCTNGNDGSITTMITGGHGNYQLQWSNGQQNENISGLINGFYTLTVTSGDCQVEQTFSLTSPAGFSIIANQSSPSCSEATDAAIDLMVSGGLPPYSYQWSDGASTASNTNLGAGIYLVTLTDANHCSTTRGYQITAPPLLQVQANTIAAQEGNDGVAILNITGGTPPYLIQWAHGPQQATLSNLAAGSYSALIIDAQGCTVSTFITIQEAGADIGDLIYCTMSGASTSYEWIDAITINGNNYFSGNDGGFGDYTAIRIPLTKGVVQNINLSPAYTLTPYNEHWIVWIDFNQDGDFNDSNEEIINVGPQVGSINTSFTIPAIALSGETRMRVAMQYAHGAELCDNLTYGEVEDYMVDISSIDNSQNTFGASRMNFSVFESPRWIAYPNPFSSKTTLQGVVTEDTEVSIQIFNGMGQKLQEETLQASKGNFSHQLDMEDLKTGTYFIKIIAMDEVQKLTLVKM